MDSTRNLGPFLGVCLSALMILAPAPSSTAVDPPPTLLLFDNKVSISLREAARYRLSVSSRPVLEVVSAVSPGLAVLADPSLASATLHDTLSGLYGARLHESTVPMGYALVWDGTHWVVVCSSVSTFEIDFGSQGTVVVESRDVTTY